MNIMIIGLGPHAKRIYFKFLMENSIIPKLIVDLDEKKENIEKFLKDNKVSDVELYFVKSNERNNLELSEEVKRDLNKFIIKYNITHAIISTEPKAHFAYAMFLLKNNINILMDKPITAPCNVINNISQANRIQEEYEILCEEYRKRKTINEDLLFSIQCQRRFHRGYIYVKKLLTEIVKEYNIPITYIDIYHNDGMWNMPDELIYRENHPYKYGYGKLFHSGYHFIDLLTWILDVNCETRDKKINKASIYSEGYTPKDFVYNFNKRDYKNLLGTDRYNEIIDNNKMLDNYGEIDIHSIINFYNNETLITNCSLNLMQSGFSRRSWSELPEDTYKSNGRVRHERVNIEVGPLFNIQVHSYQAYEVKEREKHGGNNVGDIEHFDIYIFRNVDIIGGVPFEKFTLKDLDNKNIDGKFIGYNEKAREKCFKDFINNVNNDSNILLHKQSIIITEMLYKSLIYGGKKMSFEFNLDKIGDNDNIVKITDKDFGLEEKINNDTPIVRMGSRGIIVNDEGKIAVIYKKNKNEYKLPGGGVENNENVKEAFKRECEEEIASQVEIINFLGTAEEYKSQENFKQLSFVFLGRKVMELNNTNFTEQEKNEGTSYLWLDKLDALEKMKYSLKNLKSSEYDNVYRTRFMVLRDIKILEYYINKI